MTLRTKIEVGLGLVLVIASLVIAIEYFHEHETRAVTEAKIAAANDAMVQRDKAAKAQADQIQQLVAQVKTPAQVVKTIPQLVSLPSPLRIIPAPVEQADAPIGTKNVPGIGREVQPPASSTIDAPQPGDMVVPKADVVPMFQQIAHGKQAEINLAACEQDKTTLAGERDDAQRALKGGTLFTRLKRNSKWFGIGAAIGAGAGIYATHR